MAKFLVFAYLLEKGEERMRRIGNANLSYTSKQCRLEHNKRASSHTIWARREARLRKYQGLKNGGRRKGKGAWEM